MREKVRPHFEAAMQAGNVGDTLVAFDDDGRGLSTSIWRRILTPFERRAVYVLRIARLRGMRTHNTHVVTNAYLEASR